MNADIQLSDTHPHGTPAGYLQGCHGSHCPAGVWKRGRSTRMA